MQSLRQPKNSQADALKALRADLLKYRKDEQRFSKNLAELNLREPYAVPLVARFYGDYLEMEKKLELRSDFDKAEL